MRAFGLKHTARDLAAATSGVPLLPGTGLLDRRRPRAGGGARIGYPVMLKSTAGGGGIGMRSDLERRRAGRGLPVGRAAGARQLQGSRHLPREVRRARAPHRGADLRRRRGHVVALGERDCSVQRRNQKVIEETPAPGLTDAQRASCSPPPCAWARRWLPLAGTVEFVYDADRRVLLPRSEHPPAGRARRHREVTGVDLVEWMVQGSRPANCRRLPALNPGGASIQVRLYAEDPARISSPAPAC
jgi:urea carboxylase